MLATIIIGLIAGWLAGKLIRGRGFGLIGDLVLGLIGGVVGGWIFTELNVPGPSGTSGAIGVATIGAVVLVGLAHTLRGVA